MLPYLLGAGASSLAATVVAALLIKRFVRSPRLWQVLLAGYGMTVITFVYPVWAPALRGETNFGLRLAEDITTQLLALFCISALAHTRRLPFSIANLPLLGYSGLALGIGVAGGGLPCLRLTGAIVVFLTALSGLLLMATRVRDYPLRDSVAFWVLAAFLLKFPAQVATANFVHLTGLRGPAHILWLYFAVSIIPGIISSLYLYFATRAACE